MSDPNVKPDLPKIFSIIALIVGVMAGIATAADIIDFRWGGFIAILSAVINNLCTPVYKPTVLSK